MQFVKKDGWKKEIASLAKQGKARVQRVHVMLCSILAHAAEHGDHDGFNALMPALSNAERALVGKWLPTYGPLVLGKDGIVRKNRAPTAAEFNVEGAVANVYDLHRAPARDPEAFDLDALVKYLRKKGDAKDADPAVARFAARFVRELEAAEELAELHALKAQADVSLAHAAVNAEAAARTAMLN